MFNYDTSSILKGFLASQEDTAPAYADQTELYTDCFSMVEETIKQGDNKKINLDILDDSTRYSVDEYYSLLNNPNLDKSYLVFLDNADGENDEEIIKKSVEKATLLCDLADSYKDQSDCEMIQYINKSIEVYGEDFLNHISFEENNGQNEIVISDGENFIAYDTKTAEVTRCSAVSPIAIIPGVIIDARDGDTKDGQIGDTNQGDTGDCWLLSGINALSYTEEGKEIIKNALEYHDGYTIVHLATGDYVVSDADVITTKGSVQYSSGDDDMIIFELAIEQVLDEIANGDVEFTEDAPRYLTNDTDDDGNRESTSWWHSATEGGWSNELWYFLTGKKSDSLSNKDAVAQALDEFQQDKGNNIALGCSISSFDEKEVEGLSKDIHGKYYISDVDGKKHHIGAPHAYAIKEVTDDTVTVINPWDSSDEIVLTREQYMALFDYTRKIDLSDNNKQKDYTTFNIKDENGNVQNYENRRIEYDNNGQVKWTAYDGVDENGQRITAFDIDGDGVIDQYCQNGEHYTNTYYTNSNGQKMLKREYTNGKKTKTDIFEVDNQGNKRKIKTTKYDDTGNESSQIEYSYEDSGSYKADEFSQGKNTYRYYYDSDGNLIKTIKFNYDETTGEYIGYEEI